MPGITFIEFTYADKGFLAIIERIDHLPFSDFVEARPIAMVGFCASGIVFAFEKIRGSNLSGSVCVNLPYAWLLVMSSNFSHFNPIYLNPAT